MLANEQVIEGRGWRSGALVEKKKIPQWYVKITKYADELLNHLDKLKDWPESVKTMQRNWIGRSEGVLLKFNVQELEDFVEVFTTRPDTLLGVTFLALSPEHSIVEKIARNDTALSLKLKTWKKNDLRETDPNSLEKEGINLDIKAIHPISGKEIEVWVANFVVSTYGTGAVMSVPAHDQRDWEFAKKYKLPIIEVIEPISPQFSDVEESAFEQKGILKNSGTLDGLTSEEASKQIVKLLERSGLGEKKVQYKLRDWLISRQRFWGCPIPILYLEDGSIQIESEKNLPITLPIKEAISGRVKPLADYDEFKNISNADGTTSLRETDTFDTFFESSWYYARYCCFDSTEQMLDERVDYWLPVDVYIGGIEHAVLHLLYARFFNKVMRDEV